MNNQFNEFEDLIKDFYTQVLTGHLRRGLLSRRLADKISKIKSSSLRRERSFRDITSSSTLGYENVKAPLTTRAKTRKYFDLEEPGKPEN